MSDIGIFSTVIDLHAPTSTFAVTEGPSGKTGYYANNRLDLTMPRCTGKCAQHGDGRNP